MSQKNKDNKQRWRSVTVGFRVSLEEAYALDMRVLTSELTKQDYCTKKILDELIIVRPNIRVQKYVCQYLTELITELKRLEKIEQTSDVLDNIKYLLELILHLSDKNKIFFTKINCKNWKTKNTKRYLSCVMNIVK